jgi:hypothetical protein
MRFCYHFFYFFLERYAVCNIARQGLFFIFMKFSNLNFKKYSSEVMILQSKEAWTCYPPEDFSSADCQHSLSTETRTRNPPWEWVSAGNNQLMEDDPDRAVQNAWKILKTVTISGSATTTPIYCKGKLNKKFKYENIIKMKNKPDPALFRSSYLFNKIKHYLFKQEASLSLERNNHPTVSANLKQTWWVLRRYFRTF